MIAQAPSRTDVQARLTAAQAEILGLGVRRLALFGSVRRDAARCCAMLRDAARVDSDVDVLVEFVPGQKTFDHFIALGDLLERVLGHEVELVTPESLSPFLKPHILAEAMDVVRAV